MLCIETYVEVDATYGKAEIFSDSITLYSLMFVVLTFSR